MTRRSDDWADEERAAELCGMTAERFRKHLKLLEDAGFPKISSWNGKRFVPAIRAFWHREAKVDALLPEPAGSNHDSDGQDRWGTNERTRNAS